MDPAIEAQLPDLYAAEGEVLAAYAALRKDAPRHQKAAAAYAVHLSHVADACLWSARHCESMATRVKTAYFVAGLGVGFGLACWWLTRP